MIEPMYQNTGAAVRTPKPIEAMITRRRTTHFALKICSFSAAAVPNRRIDESRNIFERFDAIRKSFLQIRCLIFNDETDLNDQLIQAVRSFENSQSNCIKEQWKMDFASLLSLPVPMLVHFQVQLRLIHWFHLIITALSAMKQLTFGPAFSVCTQHVGET